jgi:hypothetical protein
MAFDGTEGTPIQIEQAAALTKAWRDMHPGDNKGVFIGKDHLNSILAQPGCMGIRVYFGKDLLSMNSTIVVVGADASHDDQFFAPNLIVDIGRPCPPYDALPNPLNS